MTAAAVRIPAFQSCVCLHYGKDHGDDGACLRADCPCARFERPKYHGHALQPSSGRSARVRLDRDGRDR
jgi:hypothetical protein